MPETWTLLDATDGERATFADLDAVLAVDGEPAAPPNRFREVRRFAADGVTYYLKVFRKTQRKNRLRNRCTQPRCRLDGEREAAVAAALLERGFAVARPVGLGRRGGASYYLCAAIDGQSVADRARAGQWDAARDLELARYCGSIAARGVVLTDLSADHVFDTDQGFVLIDLHNGRIRSRPTRREGVRMLRRFAKSVRGLSIDRRRALRFAVALLRAAGLSRTARGVIERLPPFDTHGRYDAADRSGRYRDRNPTRAAREQKLLDAAWPGRAGDVVLDSPCGAGRLADYVRSQEATWWAADRSQAMLAQAGRAVPSAPRLQCDATRLPFRDRAVDGAIVFRLLHHLPLDRARACVQEAMRVADDWVIVSFFHPISAHNARRRVSGWLRGRAKTRFTLWPGDLRTWFRDAGFEVRFEAEARYRRDLWLAVARRK